MKAGYRYDAKTCFRCGNLVYYNWYIRHRRSGCVLGIVAAPSNNGVQPTAEPPALCLGYIQVARSGDADALTCAGCGGQIASLPWLAVMAAGATIHLDGPYCPGCATSE